MVKVLGKTIPPPEVYSPEILEAIERPSERSGDVYGWDIWHCYELSWLVDKAMVTWVGVLDIPASSSLTIESKSLKLYLNSLNNHSFQSNREATDTIERDLMGAIGMPVSMAIFSPNELWSITKQVTATNLPEYRRNGQVGSKNKREIKISEGQEKKVGEQLISHDLRSLCPVTGQPDWATLWISYTGAALDHNSVAGYLDGYAFYRTFHEAFVDQIFADLNQASSPEYLQVVAFFQRRGGIDITPWRCSEPIESNPLRLDRQ